MAEQSPAAMARSTATSGGVTRADGEVDALQPEAGGQGHGGGVAGHQHAVGGQRGHGVVAALGDEVGGVLAQATTRGGSGAMDGCVLQVGDQLLGADAWTRPGGGGRAPRRRSPCRRWCRGSRRRGCPGCTRASRCRRPRRRPTPKRSSITSGGRSSTSLTPRVWWAASARRHQPGLLGQERVDPVAGDDHLGPELGAVAVGAHADHPAAAVAEQPGGHGGGEQAGPGLGGLGRPARQSKCGPQGGHAVVGGGTPGLGPVVDRQRLGRRSSSWSTGAPPSARPAPPPTSAGTISSSTRP